MINTSTYDNYLLKTSSIHKKIPQIKTQMTGTSFYIILYVRVSYQSTYQRKG